MIKIITMANCDQCRTTRMLLKKYRLEYEEINQIDAYHDDYPIIYNDGIRLTYKEFLREVKKWKQ